MLDCAGQLHSRFLFPALQEGRHRWHFLVNFQFVFVPWDTMCPIKGGERGKLLRQSGWPTTGKMNHVCPPPHLNWRCRSQDQGSGSPHCSHCELWCRVNSAGRKMIFFLLHWWLSVKLDVKVQFFTNSCKVVNREWWEFTWSSFVLFCLRFLQFVLIQLSLFSVISDLTGTADIYEGILLILGAHSLMLLLLIP